MLCNNERVDGPCLDIPCTSVELKKMKMSLYYSTRCKVTWIPEPAQILTRYGVLVVQLPTYLMLELPCAEIAKWVDSVYYQTRHTAFLG